MSKRVGARDEYFSEGHQTLEEAKGVKELPWQRTLEDAYGAKELSCQHALE